LKTPLCAETVKNAGTPALLVIKPIAKFIWGSEVMEDWTPEEVQEACELVMEGNIFLSSLKNLEEYK
jgi:hypothetical protein